MVKVQFFSLLRLLLKREMVEIAWSDGDNVRTLLDKVQAQVPTPFLGKLLDEGGQLHAGTIILVNRKNILHLDGLETRASDGDLIACFPPGAGG